MFMVVFEKILRHTLSTNPDPGEVQLLDAAMRQQYNDLPERLRPRLVGRGGRQRRQVPVGDAAGHRELRRPGPAAGQSARHLG